MNKHTGRHLTGMVLAGIMLLSVPAHSGETQNRTLRPDEPNPESALFGNVAPSDTVYFNVSVYTPEGYTLDKTEWSRTGNNELFLWAGSGLSFSLVNTAWEPGTTTARVDAWWNGGEGGGGAGGGGSIHRYATGTASAEGVAESYLLVRVSPEVAPVGSGVTGQAFGKKIPSGEEFAVRANWSVNASGYFKGVNQNVSSVSFSSDEPQSINVTAVNNGPPARQGSTSAQFVKVELDDSDLWFFRSESYELPSTIIPLSASELLSVSLSGFDSDHWIASYDSAGKKIDLVNLIEDSDPMVWLDEQMLSISAGIAGATGQWNWTKKVDLKKRIDGISDVIMDSLASTLAEQFATAPGEYAGDVVSDQMGEQSVLDSNGIERYFSEMRIGEVADVVKENINNAWSDFTGTTLPGDIHSQNLHDQVTSESFMWTWNTKLTINVVGGSVSVDQGGNPHLNPGDWVKAVNNNGWTSKLFEPQKLSISSTLTGDGHVGHALFKARLFGEVWCSFDGYKDPETQDWTNGGHFGGMTVGLLLECWF